MWSLLLSLASDGFGASSLLELCYHLQRGYCALATFSFRNPRGTTNAVLRVTYC